MTTKQDDAATDLLIKEVDEDLRQDELNQLWKRHGGLLVAAAIAVVVGVAGWQAWSSWDTKQRREASLNFSEAVTLAEQGRRDEAIELLNRQTTGQTKGYRILAEMRLADLRLQQGDTAAAIATFRRIAADDSVDKAHRDMAAIRAAYLGVDSDDPAALDKAMEPLAVEASSWRHSAREIQALAAIRRGDTTRAAELLSRIAEDAAAPQGLRTRAAELLSAIGQRARS